MISLDEIATHMRKKRQKYSRQLSIEMNVLAVLLNSSDKFGFMENNANPPLLQNIRNS
jgi:hypothetical protein